MSGTLTRKYGGAQMKQDDAQLVQYLKDSGQLEFIKTEEKPKQLPDPVKLCLFLCDFPAGPVCAAVVGDPPRRARAFGFFLSPESVVYSLQFLQRNGRSRSFGTQGQGWGQGRRATR